MSTPNDRLRALPAVDTLANSAAGAALAGQYGRQSALDAIRSVLDDTRAHLRAGDTASYDVEALLAQAAERLQRAFLPSLRAVINATGVIIHTNLGRAPLSAGAQQAIVEAAAAYTTLEYDLDSGQRGSRSVHAARLLQEVTGAEAALVVNNNAAGLVLLLSALARGREVVISRGQLVEIGGGFRVPDVMAQSGATLVEVGTTNRTRAADYERAITPNTALLMRAHASNFKQIGFVETTPLSEMAEIAHRHGLYLVDDVGSGALLDTAAFGLDHEPTVQESLQAGADLVVFSGDKLLGGPQAGLLVGRKALIDLLKQHPLARAIRAD
jgi:L-seryl-tRNA(Ser) seleniumtransferase